jgi:UDP-N-acetylmuramyl tripeptide synthase
VLDLVVLESHPVVLVLNAEAADGRDPSWLWDVPFELLRGRRVLVTGRRGADLSVRLRYAQVDHEVTDDLSSALAAVGPTPCDVVASYTAFAVANRRLQPLGGGS